MMLFKKKSKKPVWKKEYVKIGNFIDLNCETEPGINTHLYSLSLEKTGYGTYMTVNDETAGHIIVFNIDNVIHDMIAELKPKEQ